MEIEGEPFVCGILLLEKSCISNELFLKEAAEYVIATRAEGCCPPPHECKQGIDDVCRSPLCGVTEAAPPPPFACQDHPIRPSPGVAAAKLVVKERRSLLRTSKSCLHFQDFLLLLFKKGEIKLGGKERNATSPAR